MKVEMSIAEDLVKHITRQYNILDMFDQTRCRGNSAVLVKGLEQFINHNEGEPRAVLVCGYHMEGVNILDRSKIEKKEMNVTSATWDTVLRDISGNQSPVVVDLSAIQHLVSEHLSVLNKINGYLKEEKEDED